jgi:hypothetical protein
MNLENKFRQGVEAMIHLFKNVVCSVLTGSQQSEVVLRSRLMPVRGAFVCVFCVFARGRVFFALF